MGVLRAGLGLEVARLAGVVFRAVVAGDIVPRGGEGFLAQTQGVGAHIGDEADGAVAGHFHTLIELLGNGHGAPRRHTESAGCFLLQSGGDERGRGGFLLFTALDVIHRESRALHGSKNTVHLVLRVQLLLLVSLAVKARGEGGIVHPAVEAGVQEPVFLGLEGLDLLLAVYHHACGDRLDTACAQSLFDLLPEKRRELIAHNAVEDAARLLGVHQVLVDAAGVLDALGDDLLRDLVEGDALGLLVIQLQKLL